MGTANYMAVRLLLVLPCISRMAGAVAAPWCSWAGKTFDGSGTDSVQLENEGCNQAFGGTAMSLALSFRCDGACDGASKAAGKVGLAFLTMGGNYLHLVFKYGKLRPYWETGGNFFGGWGPFVRAGETDNVLFVVGGGELKVWVDGVVVLQVQDALLVPAGGATSMTVGRFGGIVNTGLQGEISNLRIWDGLALDWAEAYDWAAPTTLMPTVQQPVCSWPGRTFDGTDADWARLDQTDCTGMLGGTALSLALVFRCDGACEGPNNAEGKLGITYWARSQDALHITLKHGRLRTQFEKPAGNYFGGTDTGPLVEQGRTYSLLFTVGGGRLKVWVDGVITEDVQDARLVPVDEEREIWVGKFSNLAGMALQGAVYDFRVWDDLLLTWEDAYPTTTSSTTVAAPWCSWSGKTFDGSGTDFVELENEGCNQAFGGTALSLALTFRCDGACDGAGKLDGKVGVALLKMAGNFLHFTVQHGKLIPQWETSGNWFGSWGPFVRAGETYSTLVVVGGGELKAWVDGVIVLQVQDALLVPAGGATTMTVGRFGAEVNTGLQGAVSNLRIWDGLALHWAEAYDWAAPTTLMPTVQQPVCSWPGRTFDGTDTDFARLDLETDCNGMLGGTALSLALVFRCDGACEGPNNAEGKVGITYWAHSQDQLHITLGGGTLWTQFEKRGGHWFGGAGPVIVPGRAYSVLYTVGGGRLKVWVDGVVTQDVQDAMLVPTDEERGIMVGKFGDHAGMALQGAVYDFRVWDDLLLTWEDAYPTTTSTSSTSSETSTTGTSSTSTSASLTSSSSSSLTSLTSSTGTSSVTSLMPIGTSSSTTSTLPRTETSSTEAPPWPFSTAATWRETTSGGFSSSAAAMPMAGSTTPEATAPAVPADITTQEPATGAAATTPLLPRTSWQRSEATTPEAARVTAAPAGMTTQEPSTRVAASTPLTSWPEATTPGATTAVGAAAESSSAEPSVTSTGAVLLGGASSSAAKGASDTAADGTPAASAGSASSSSDAMVATLALTTPAGGSSGAALLTVRQVLRGLASRRVTAAAAAEASLVEAMDLSMLAAAGNLGLERAELSTSMPREFMEESSLLLETEVLGTTAAPGAELAAALPRGLGPALLSNVPEITGFQELLAPGASLELGALEIVQQGLTTATVAPHEAESIKETVEEIEAAKKAAIRRLAAQDWSVSTAPLPGGEALALFKVGPLLQRLGRNASLRLPLPQELDLSVTLPGPLLSSIDREAVFSAAVLNASHPRWSTGQASLTAAAVVLLDFSSATGDSLQISGLKEPITFTLPAKFSEAMGCRYLDERRLLWSREGVSTGADNVPGEDLVCESLHLSFFGAILQGITKTLACSNFGLLSPMALSQIVRRSWCANPGALLFWALLALLLLAFLLAARQDCRHGSAWHPEFFLFEDLAPPPSPPSGAEEAGSFPRAGPCWLLSCARGALTTIWESGALHQALDEFVSHWCELLAQLRAMLGTLHSSLRLEAMLSIGLADLKAIARSGLVHMLLLTSRHRAGASMALHEEVVDFVCEDEDIGRFLMRAAAQLPASHHREWRLLAQRRGQDFTACQRQAWQLLHAEVTHNLVSKTHAYGSSSCLDAVCQLLANTNPLGSALQFNIFRSCKLRVLVMAMETMSALAISCAFFQVGGLDLQTPIGSAQPACSEEGELESGMAFVIGRVLVISTASVLLASVPASFILSLHTMTGIKHMDYRGSKAWARQLLAWRVQLALVWTVAGAYLLLCILFILSFLANINTADDADWSVAGLMTLCEDLAFVPLLVSIILPCATATCLAVHRAAGGNTARLLRDAGEALHRHGNVMMPIERL